MREIDSEFCPGVTPDYALIIQSDEHLAKFETYLRTHALKPDASPATPSGRKEIKSRAYAVARHKTGLDDAGKALGDQFRVKLDAINERRRTIKKKLETLQEDVSRPVDEWERQDKARTDMVHGLLTRIGALSVVSIDTDSSEVHARISELQKMEIEHSAFQEMWDAAVSNRDKAVEMLALAFQRLQKQEQEAAELAKLRADAVERDARDAEEARRREQEATVEAALKEQKRLEKERAEASRIQAEKAAAVAAEAARLKAEKEAADALAERDRQHQAEMARIQKERDDALAVERREREAALAREQAQRDEDARRQADQQHRVRVMAEAGNAMCEVMACDYNSPRGTTVQDVVRAIAEGRVPHIKMEF